MSFFSRFMNVFRDRRVRREWDEELRFHVEARTEDLVHAGMTRDTAAAEAARRLGRTLAARDASRDVKLLPWLDALLRDARFGLRMLRRHAIVSAAAIVSLSLAIGACTAAFSLIDALILRPLPVAHPEQLVTLAASARAPGDPGAAPRDMTSFNYPLFQRLRAAAAPRLTLFAISDARMRTIMFDDVPADARRLRAQWISGNTFAQLGLRPALGRFISDDDDRQPGQHPVAVISHALWMRRFGGSPVVLGRWLTADDKVSAQIIGVAPAGFTGVEPGVRTDVWLPQMMWDNPVALSDGGWSWFRIFGRLAPDGLDTDSVASAAIANATDAAPREPLRAQLQTIYTAFRQEMARTMFPADEPAENVARYVSPTLHLRPAANGPSSLRQSLARPLWILGLVSGLVLLIACSNVASLMLARAAARERELAVRVSLGAGRARLVQQVLVENAILAVASSALGLLFALTAAPLLVSRLAPADNPAYLDVRFDWRVLAFVSLIGLLTSVLFGLAPAWRARGVAPHDVLKAGGSRVARGTRMFRPLIAAQIAFSGIVLFLAGLFLLSFQRLVQVDPGFDADRLLLFDVKAQLLSADSDARGDADSAARATAAITTQLRDAVRDIPGVRAASLSRWSLFSSSGSNPRLRLPGRSSDTQETWYLAVSPGFLDTLGIGLIAGRDFEPRDLATLESSAVIVNETFARRFFPGENPIGRRFGRLTGPGRIRDQEIIGVMRDARYNDLRAPAPPTVYAPLTDLDGASLSLQVRTALPPAEAIALVRGVLPRVHPSLRVAGVTRQATLIDDTLIRERLLALLSGFFALVSIVLAGVGLYGVLSYTVVQRTHEIGIRLALGARRSRVVRIVIADITLVSLVGLAAGLGGGLLLARQVSTLLFDVRPSDLASLAWPAACLAVAALLAGLPPAWRATRVDPLIALRRD